MIKHRAKEEVYLATILQGQARDSTLRVLDQARLLCLVSASENRLKTLVASKTCRCSRWSRCKIWLTWCQVKGLWLLSKWLSWCSSSRWWWLWWCNSNSSSSIKIQLWLEINPLFLAASTSLEPCPLWARSLEILRTRETRVLRPLKTLKLLSLNLTRALVV